MKPILTLCAALLLFTQTPLSAQVPAAPPEEEPMLEPEVMPSFMGGDLINFCSWLNDEMIYPSKAVERRINGEVEASFVIEENGKLTNIKILESTDGLFSKEVIRALKKSPRWISGSEFQDGDLRTYSVNGRKAI